MRDADLPPDTIATMAHGRVTIQAWWRDSARTESGRALSWGVNGGPEIDLSRVEPKGNAEHASIVGFWSMGNAHHVQLPWRLTDYGKALAAECPCGPCSWTDPPARAKRRPTAPVEVTSKMRREARRANERWYREQIEAAERREREAKLEAREQRRLREERFKRLLEEARAEREAELAAARAKAQASVDRLAERIRRDLGEAGVSVAAGMRRVVGQFIRAGAPAPRAEDVREKRSRAGKARAAGAVRVGGRFVKKGTETT